MPYSSFVAQATGTIDEVKSALQAHVNKATWFAWHRVSREFQGAVWDEGFRVQRAVRGRELFTPVIRGTFAPQTRGTRVEVWLTFHPIAWTLLLSISVPLIIDIFRVTSGADPPGKFGVVAALLILLGLWVNATITFVRDARRAKRMLYQLLELHDPQTGGV